MKKRISCIALALVLTLTMVFGNSNVSTNDVKAAEKQKTMKMPITIYDHLNDNLLFEYDLGKMSYFDLESFGDVTGQGLGEGLVENELSPMGTPVYKQAVVEKLASNLKKYMEEDNVVENKLYKQIFEQVADHGNNTNIMGIMDMETLGWSFDGLKKGTTALEGIDDYWCEKDGEPVWFRKGDELHVTGGSNKKATFDFGILKPGNYSINYWSNSTKNVSAKIEYNGNSYEVVGNEGSKLDFSLTENTDVKLVIESKSDEEGCFTAPTLIKDGIEYLTKFSQPLSKKISNIGFDYDSNSTWKDSPYGGLTCDNGETETISYEAKVQAGRKYQFSYVNEKRYCTVKVYDQNGKLIAEEISQEEDKNPNGSLTTVFTVPEGTDKVKLVIGCQGEATFTGGDSRRLDGLKLIGKPLAELGDYEQSKQKYSTGGKLADISTCMDYAYYMLNNFWSDTKGDITQKTSLYKALVLGLDENNGKYIFKNGSTKINYDIESGLISNDTNTVENLGFFPLDSSILGNKTDLTGKFGTNDGEIYNDYDKLYHNYHYAMKAKCQFLYEKNKNLVFEFYGDDDVYLFINNKLALDIGGAHPGRRKNLVINDVAEQLGLEDGQIYSFDFFYLERHYDASNIEIQTNMVLEQADANPSVTYKDKDGNAINQGTTVNAGDEIEINYSVKAGSDKMHDITFTDNDKNIKIGTNGIDLGEAYVKDNLVFYVVDKTGSVTNTYKISKDDLEDATKVSEFVEEIKKIELNKSEELKVTGLWEKVSPNEIFSTNLDVDIKAPQKEYDDNGNIVQVDKKVEVTPVDTFIVPKNEPKASIDVSLVDKNGDTITDAISEGTYVGLEYTLKAESEGMKNIGIEDSGTGFKIDKGGIVIPNGYEINGNLKIEIVDKDGTVKGSVSLTKDDIENNAAKYQDLLTKLDGGVVLSNGEKITVKGLYKNIDVNGISSNVKGSIKGPKSNYDEASQQYSCDIVEVNPTDNETISPKPASNVKFEIDDTIGGLKGDSGFRVDNGLAVGKQPIVEPKEGYIFSKWTITENGQTKDYSGDPKDYVVNNDVTFTAVLVPKQYEYTVKYLEIGTGKELRDKVVKSAYFASTVTEESEDIYGYNLEGSNSQNITIKTSGNEIVFEYSKKDYNVTFEVDRHGTLTGNTDQTVKYEEKVNSVPTVDTDEGYEFLGWEKVTSTGTVKSENPSDETIIEDTKFVAKIGPKKYDYVVKYVDEDGNELLAEKRVADADFDSKVTEDAGNIYGYTPDSDSKSITIKVSDNEIKFVYTKKSYDVKFTTDDDGTLSGDTDKTVDYKDKVNNKPDVIVKEGYKFKGWEMKVGGNDPIEVENPLDVEITADTVFTAKYEKETYDYTIKYVDKDGKELLKPVSKKALYGDKVTEEAADILGYTPDSKDKSITIKVVGNEIIFTYSQDSKSYNENNGSNGNNDKNNNKNNNKNSSTDKDNNKKNNSNSKSGSNNNNSNNSGNNVNGGTDTSSVSPKTGYTNVLAMLMAMLMMSLGMAFFSIRKIKR